jgi:hypothetical protein
MTGIGVHACNPTGTRRTANKFKASLRNMARPCIKKGWGYSQQQVSGLIPSTAKVKKFINSDNNVKVLHSS